MLNLDVLKNRLAASIVAALAVAANATAQGSSSPVLLVIDKQSIEFGVEQYQVPPDALNEVIAAIGVRDPLPFFASNIGQQFYLRTGVTGNDSWFGFDAVPTSWTSDGGVGDGLQNFALAGPGLGSPDPTGERESLLQFVQGVRTVRAAGATLLMGRPVCAIIYENDLRGPQDGADANLQGANLGMLAFRINGVINAASESAIAVVQILDVRETCTGTLETLPQPSA